MVVSKIVRAFTTKIPPPFHTSRQRREKILSLEGRGLRRG